MRLKTLGGLTLTSAAGDRPLQRPKPLLLLTYLAVEGPKERHHLAELFWPAANQPLDSLRVALSQIRTAAPGVLSEADSAGAGAIVGTSVICDAIELFEALSRRDAKLGRTLYAGEFLAGFYLKEMGAELEEWVLATREYLSTGLQLACVIEAEMLAAGSALAEGGRLAAEALALVKETDPALLPRLHRLLIAANHPFAAVVERQADGYGMELNASAEAAATQLISATKRSAPDNLPSRVAPFVGRDTELVLLTNLLASGRRLVTVTGVGGVGKSRLALEAAKTALRDGLFEDGVFMVELATVTSAENVLGALAAAVDPGGGRGDAAQLAQTLVDRKILVLLDNFEHVSEAALELAELLETSPGLTALVTSRRPLDLSGEQLFQLSALDVPTSSPTVEGMLALEAVQLFQIAARRSQLSFVVDDDNRAEVLEICRLVHGLPLGIELAAAWVGRLPLAELTSALGLGSDDLLSGPRDAAPRHRSLRATIEHSWNLLGTQERSSLARLAAFSGGFSHEAAARVAGASIATLRVLAARSLLNASSDGRYDAHPLVAKYARERLAANPVEHDSALAAHAGYYAELAGRAEGKLRGADQAEWLRWLDAELPNLQAAMSWHLARAEEGSLEASRAALTLSGDLWRYWLQRGRLAEGRRLADAALRSAPDDQLPIERAKALSGAGVLAQSQGDEAASEAYHRAALELRRAAGDRLGVARSLYNLASIAGKAGDLETAEQYLAAAIEGFHELGDDWSAAFALFNQATLARRKGHDDEARAHLEERLRLLTRLGDDAGASGAHDALGHIHLSAGDLSAADEAFEKALEIARRLQDYPEQASSLEGLALVAHERGRHRASGELFDEASALRSQHGLGTTDAYERLAELHLDRSADARLGRKG